MTDGDKDQSPPIVNNEISAQASPGLGLQNLFKPKEKTPLQIAQTKAQTVAQRVFNETGIIPKDGWKGKVDEWVQGGPEGQTRLLFMLAKPFAEPKRVIDGSKQETAQAIVKNMKDKSATQIVQAGKKTAVHTDLMHGNNELQGNATLSLLQSIGGEVVPFQTYTNDGEKIPQTASHDQAIVTFPHLPDIGVKITVTHPDRRNTGPNSFKPLDQMFDGKSSVTNLTVVPLKKETVRESVW